MPDPSPPRPAIGRASPWLRLHPVVAVAAGFAVLTLTAAAVGLWQFRRDTVAAQQRSMATLATAISSEVERGLLGLVDALWTTAQQVREGRILLRDANAAAVLRDRARLLPLVDSLWVLDSQDRVVTASTTAPLPALRSFLPFQSPSPEAPDLALSAPFTDPADGIVRVALALRIPAGAVQDAAWVVAGVPAAELQGAFARAQPAADARLLVRRADGVRLAGFLGKTKQAGSGEDAALAHLPPADGSVALLPWPDGSQRMVQVRTLEVFPIEIIMTRNPRMALARWRELAQMSALVLLAAMAALALLLAGLLRAERARARAQEALLAEQARAATAAAAAQEGNWEWDLARGDLPVSPRMKELLGQPRDGAPRRLTLQDLGRTLHPDDAAALHETLQRLPADGRAEDQAIDLSLRVQQGDGRWRWVRLRGRAGAHPGPGLTASGIASDTTEERERAAQTRRLESQLARARKLESLGTLAGGVAHDFNNILATLLGYAEMAAQAAAPGSAQARHLGQVLQAGQRGRAVVDRIMAFSGSGTRPQELLEVQPVVEQVLELLRVTMGPRVRLERHLDVLPLRIRGDATQLFEAIMNLCTNALQAMPEGGTLTVSVTACDQAEGEWLSHGRVPAARCVAVAVGDTGAGFGPEVMEHLFEPFFTTKGRSGTGLGLAVVHGVVDDFEGAIDVKSVRGGGSEGGSTFTLYFPRLDEGAWPVAEAGQAAPDEQGRGEHILVVDDERPLVHLAEETLRALGYQPAGFADPHEALAAFAADPARFDLVITDEIMPGLAGTELVQRLRTLRADIPVLLLSGYGGPQLVQRAQAAGVGRVLVKPLVRGDLAAAVAGVLRRGTGVGAPGYDGGNPENPP